MLITGRPGIAISIRVSLLYAEELALLIFTHITILFIEERMWS